MFWCWESDAAVAEIYVHFVWGETWLRPEIACDFFVYRRTIRRTIDRNFIGLLSWAFFFFCCTCWPQIVENRNISLPGLLPVGKVHALSSQLCHPLSTFTFSYDFCPEPRHLGCSIMPTKLQAGMMGEPLCLCNSTELCPVFCGEHLSCSGHRFGQERLKTCNEMLLQIVLHAVPVIPLDGQATCQSAC